MGIVFMYKLISCRWLVNEFGHILREEYLDSNANRYSPSLEEKDEILEYAKGYLRGLITL